MTLKHYTCLAVVLFLIGILTLYSGFNRAPFRQAPGHSHPAQHGLQLPKQTQTIVTSIAAHASKPYSFDI